MTSYMGPMAPPQAAQPQPQALDIRTMPNQRANFKNFMKQRSAIMPMQPQPQPQPMMPLMQQQPVRLAMGGGVDIFDPMYSSPMMAPSAPTGFEGGGGVPPRRTEIRGQDHMLSYITPDEAGILKALGGSGEAGPMGIPSYAEDDGDEDPDSSFDGGFGSDSDDVGGGFGGGDSTDDGSGGGDDSGFMGGDQGGYDRIADAINEQQRAEEQAQAVRDIQLISANDPANDIFAPIDIFAPTRVPTPPAIDEFASPDLPLDTRTVQQRVSDLIDDAARSSDRSIASTSGQGVTPEVQNLLGLEINDLLAQDISSKGGKVDVNPQTGQVIASSYPTAQQPMTFVPDSIKNKIEDAKMDVLGDTKTIDEGDLRLNPGLNDELFGDTKTIDEGDIRLNPSLRENPVSIYDRNPNYEESVGGNINTTALPDGSSLLDYRGLTTDLLQQSVTPPDPLSDAVSRAQQVAQQGGIPSITLPDTVFDVDTRSDMERALAESARSKGIMDAFQDQYNKDAAAARAQPNMVDAETDMEQRVLTDPNRSGYTNDLPDRLKTFTRPDGVTVSRNLGGLTEAQRASQPFYMDLAQMAGDKPYGYEIKDGEIVGSVGSGIGLLGPLTRGLQNLIGGPPQTTEDLLKRGVYTGLTDISGPPEPENDFIPRVKAPNDPCPTGYSLVNGVCTPIDESKTVDNSLGSTNTASPYIAPPVVVASNRQQNIPSMQGPVGYGINTVGQFAPSVASNASFFQQMLNQQGQRAPLRLQEGGSVTSSLDQAADNFLKALQPVA